MALDKDVLVKFTVPGSSGLLSNGSNMLILGAGARGAPNVRGNWR